LIVSDPSVCGENPLSKEHMFQPNMFWSCGIWVIALSAYMSSTQRFLRNLSKRLSSYLLKTVQSRFYANQAG